MLSNQVSVGAGDWLCVPCHRHSSPGSGFPPPNAFSHPVVVSKKFIYQGLGALSLPSETPLRVSGLAGPGPPNHPRLAETCPSAQTVDRRAQDTLQYR